MTIYLPMKTTLTQTWQRFWTQSKEIQAMTFLYWVYELGQAITSTFLSIYILLVTQSVAALITYQGIFWIGVFIGFCVWGVIIAQWQISMRFNYLKTFLIYFSSFVILLVLPKTASTMFIFAALNGLALGMFWLGVHSYEMIHTNDESRDFYSSMVTLGGQVVSVIAPLLATTLFFMAEWIFEVETYTYVFWLLPFLYLLGLPYLWQLQDYVPPKICWDHVRYICTHKETRNFRLYAVLGGWDHGTTAVIMPLISLAVLVSVINIGVFEIIIALLSILVTIFLSHKRHSQNRISLLWISIYGLIIGLALQFFYTVHPLFFFAASLIGIIVYPIFEVSAHVIDLKVVENIKRTASFYEGLLIRDAYLFVGRAIVTVLLASTFWMIQDQTKTIQIALVLLAISFVLYGLLAQKLMNKS